MRHGRRRATDSDARLSPYLDSSDIANLKKAFTLPKKQSCAGSYEAVKQLKAAGVPILVGDDVPNPGTAPGATEHRELELLVEAGLTPTEALVGATSAACAHFPFGRSRHDRPRPARGPAAGEWRSDQRILATRDIAGSVEGRVPADRGAFSAAVDKEKKQAKAQAAAAPSGRRGERMGQRLRAGKAGGQVRRRMDGLDRSP